MLNNVVNKDEVKTEIRAAIKEVAVEIVGRFFDGLFTDVKSEHKASSAHIPEGRPYQSAPDSYPVNFLDVVSGYLYMSLKDLGIKETELRGIMQKTESKINSCGYDEAAEAYEKCKKELLPVMVAGIIVPQKYEELKISELKFSSSRMCARLTNALRKEKIIYISDFRDKNIDVEKIRNIGKNAFDQFKSALINTIGNEAYEVAESVNYKGKRSIASLKTMYGDCRISGVPIPEEALDRRVDSLKYTSNVSRTKTVNTLKKHNLVYLRDFFNEGAPALSKILSYRGKQSFLETLRRSL